MLELGSRQNMTGMETKRAREHIYCNKNDNYHHKYIVLQYALNSC